MPSFKPYERKIYPKFESAEQRTFLRSLKVFPYKNPNKASISLEKRLIIADPKFYYHRYKPLKTFTLCHEVFHKFFHSKNMSEKKNRHIHEHIEKQCDKAARDFMLANGWNPTQVRLANGLLLKGAHRKECMRELTTDPKNKFRR